MEAAHVTGPAKNLIEFGTRAAPRVELSIATFLRGGESNDFVETARKAGIRVHVIAEKKRFDTAPMRELRTIIEAQQPDVIQTHHVKSHLFVYLAKLNIKRPWVAFNHGYTSTDLKDRLYNQLDRLTLRRAFQVVTVCEPFARRLEELGVPRARIRIQHNSVREFIAPSPAVVQELRNKLGLGNRRVVLTVGRLSREKGHADMVRAFALLAHRDLCLVIAGGGPERQSLEAIVREKGLDGQVFLAGNQSDIRPFYSLADVLALPSHSEGSPNVVLEAMAAGVPLVATSVGGVPEIVQNGKTGLIVPPRDSKAMADGIARILDDVRWSAEMAEAARQLVASRYTPDAHCRSLTAMYEEIVNRFGCAASG